MLLPENFNVFSERNKAELAWLQLEKRMLNALIASYIKQPEAYNVVQLKTSKAEATLTKILQLLQKKPMSPLEISLELGYAISSVYKMLSNLRCSGKIVKQKRRWIYVTKAVA